MAETVEDISLSHIVDDGPELYVINPTTSLVDGLINAIGSTDSKSPDIQILSDKQRFSAIAQRFKIASQLADFVEQDVATIQTIQDYQRNSMLISVDRLSIFPATGEPSPAFTQSVENGLGDLMEMIDSDWEESTKYSLQTPPISRIVETMETDLGAAFKHDFESTLIDIDKIYTGGTEISITTIILLVAARNDLMFYDVGHWAERIGLASRATLSRKKRELEDAEAISTSKVKQEVGRPRMKLHLNEEVATKWDETNADDAIRGVIDQAGVQTDES